MSTPSVSIICQTSQAARKAQTFSRLSRFSLLASALCAAFPASAIDFGPNDMFSLTGFAEIQFGRANNQCPAGSCQISAETDRQKVWADAIVPGLKLSSGGTSFNQAQFWLSAKHDLGNGFKVKGTLSQNLRDGSVDTPGFWRDKNIELRHEEYGILTLGHMISRTWMFADYPYGGNLGLSSAWANSGAGYRNLTNAIRYTSRTMDIAGGDVVLEVTYDKGDTAFKINKPRFLELWAHYGKGDLSVDAMYQNTRNGVPAAFGGAAFKGPFYDAAADGKLGNSGQSVAVVQAIYQLNKNVELSAALRRNKWSGAYQVVALAGPPVQWNFPFNVDWFGFDANGVAHPGYPARSTDISFGARYRMDKWTFSTGAAYFGKASTPNPAERGQSNSALVNTIGATYAYGNGLEFSAFAGMIHYGRKGLAPMSLPSNSTLNGIDSRATKAGNWFGVGAKYTF
jgi:Gram-negative porin